MSQLIRPKLSVLMTVHNGERYLRETIKSILRQTFTDFEFIVIDDGSTDNTPEIMADFARLDSRMSVQHNEKNIGIVRSMNKLFLLAQGTYLNRHDADDISLVGRFAEQVAYLDANPEVGMVTSQVEIIDDVGNRLDMDMYSGPTDNDTIQQQLLTRCSICQTSVMFRKQLLDVIGLYDSHMVVAQDYDLWLRMSEVTQIARLPTWLCQYRYHAGSISHQRSATQFRRTAEALEKTAIRRFRQSAPASLHKQIALYFVWSAERFCKANDMESARQCLVNALARSPDVFSSGSVLLPIQNMDERIAFAKSIFHDAPDFRNKSLAQRKFLASLGMRDVFEAVKKNDVDFIDRYLWPAIQSDPSWLLNRGVISLAARSVLRGARRVLTA